MFIVALIIKIWKQLTNLLKGEKKLWYIHTMEYKK